MPVCNETTSEVNGAGKTGETTSEVNGIGKTGEMTNEVNGKLYNSMNDAIKTERNIGIWN